MAFTRRASCVVDRFHAQENSEGFPAPSMELFSGHDFHFDQFRPRLAFVSCWVKQIAAAARWEPAMKFQQAIRKPRSDIRVSLPEAHKDASRADTNTQALTPVSQPVEKNGDPLRRFTAEKAGSFGCCQLGKPSPDGRW